MDATVIGDVIVSVSLGLGFWKLSRPLFKLRKASPPTQRQAPAPSAHPPLLHKIMDVGVERKRIDTEASIERARLAHAERLKIGIHATAQKNITTQVREASVEQEHSNQLANYVAPVELAKPFVDEFRNRLLLALVNLYDGEGMAKDGRLMVQAPWSKRGGWSKADVARAVTMFNDAERINGTWVVRMQANGWYVNRSTYDTPGQIVRAFRMVKTPA